MARVRQQSTLFGEDPDPAARRTARGPGPDPDSAAPPPAGGPDAGGTYVRVVVERGIDEGAGYTYRCAEPVRVGDRVRVPLGRGNAPTGGVVVEVGGAELAAGTAAHIKHVISVTPGTMSGPLLKLARWMSAYYVCPLGMTLSAMVPAAVKRGTGSKRERVYERVPGGVDAAVAETLSKRTRELLEKLGAVPEGAFPALPRRLAERLGVKTTAPLKRLSEIGALRETVRETVEARGYAPTPGPWEAGGERADARPELTPRQRAVVEGIGAGLGEFGVHLVRGVTGSGKTEVYLRLIERVIAEGKSAIVLVPEIALTPQTSGRFLRRFREHGVCVLHSGLSASQRHAEWDRAAGGGARVVVGARSAVFAPLDRLGLIVVDEEHDTSYKQDQLPRYHGRDAAIKRAQLEGCPVVLGSATPSLESWVNAHHPSSERGSRLWELPERVVGRLPPVEVVDINLERRAVVRDHPERKNRQWSIGPTLGGAIERTLRAGGQVILLLNRRGFAHYVACPDASCGWVFGCSLCDVRMVFHKKIGLPRGGDVACHHCLTRQVLPRVCPDCGGPITLFGSGTQRVEEEVTRLVEACGLDGRAVIRADSDSMGSARDYFDALDRFGRAEARVLLGTQMIAKGLDFPNVQLVGVVSADTALSLPDFRSSERTFQLISQVAGRAGRGSAGGRVIVQTMEPGNPAVQFAARHDYVAFARREAESRRGYGLPPSTRMARVVCRDAHATRARDAAGTIAAALREAAPCGDEGAGPGGVRVLGPMECPINRLHGKFRFATEVFAPSPVELNRCLATLRASGLLVSDARTAVDVDPVALL